MTAPAADTARPVGRTGLIGGNPVGWSGYAAGGMPLGAPNPRGEAAAARGGLGGSYREAGALSDDERNLFEALRRQLDGEKKEHAVANAYYQAEQTLTSLGVSLPPELQTSEIKVAAGWPRIGVDSLHERMGVDGFRYPDGLDADSELWDIWKANRLELESDLAHLDALIFRKSFVRSGLDFDGSPLITVESPMFTTAMWDARRRHPSSALQFYDVDGQSFACFDKPGETITLRLDDRGQWRVSEDPNGAEGRDTHGQPWVPVMMMANRARTHDRGGQSEITSEIRGITDAAIRTLLDLEVSREFYAAPQRFILGATEEAFQKEDGSTASAWETYRGRVLALGPIDEDGEHLPQVGTFTPYNPAAFAEVINLYADMMASATGLPSTYLGKTRDQPASADAIRMSTDRLVQKVRLRHVAFAQAWEGALRMALAFRDGSIPDQARRIETIWRNPEVPTPAATTDAIHKQVDMGYLPPRSDVAGERLGYSSIERRRIEAEWAEADAQAALANVLSRVPADDRAAGDPDDDPQPGPAGAAGAAGAGGRRPGSAGSAGSAGSGSGGGSAGRAA